MPIGGIGGGYGAWNYGFNYGSSPASNTQNAEENSPYAQGAQNAEDDATVDEDAKRKPGYKSSPEECQTCKNRKYQDGSDEMDVSFKSPGHIDPDNAAQVVLGHEHEHVANAYQKADENNGKVEQATVQLKTSICPECGRTYISGGVTHTQIKYYNEDNPYQKDMKESDADNKYRGANVDIAA